MVSPPANANGNRRAVLRRRVLAEEHECALCGGLVDKSLKNVKGRHGPKCQGGDCIGCSPHPMRAEIDEDLPRSRGGSPYERDNTHLMHRVCNRVKGTMTLAEAKAKGFRTKIEHTNPKTLRITNLIEW